MQGYNRQAYTKAGETGMYEDVWKVQVVGHWNSLDQETMDAPRRRRRRRIVSVYQSLQEGLDKLR